MPLPVNVSLFASGKPESIVLDDLDIVIHGQSYASRSVTENLAAQYPLPVPNLFNIGLLHSSLTGREGHESYAPCTVDELKSKGYDYWALGHVHKRETVSEHPFIIFPGNIQGRHIKETGAKGATLVIVEDGRIMKVEERELDVLRWAVCEADLSGCETTESVYDAIRSAFEEELESSDGKTTAVRLILTGKCPVHAQLLERTAQWTEEFRGIAASQGNLWLEKVKYHTSRKVSLDEIIGKDTPIAGLVESIQKLELDGESLNALVPELAVLKTKLPAGVYSIDDPFLEASAEKIAELRNEVQEILISALLKHGGEK